MQKKTAYRLVAEIGALALSTIVLVPLYFVVVNSFKTQNDAARLSLAPPTAFRILDNYRDVFQIGSIASAFKNSVVLTFSSTLLIILFASMAAFVIQRRTATISTGRGVGRVVIGVVWYGILAGLIMPPAMATTVVLCKDIGLASSTGAIFVFTAILFPLATFIFRGFLGSIPRELDEAAVIDGCGAWRLFFQIIWPLLKPVTMTVFILSFMEVWNNFNISIYFLSSSTDYTLPLTVYFFYGQYLSSWNLVFADVVIVAIPVVVVYAITQRYIISGMVAGAIKG
jgi:raffinose/stachyose/melibiose transport system permease protein